MRCTSFATPRVFTGLAFASALCLPAAAIAAQFDYFIKLPPIEGDSGTGESQGGEIEIHSFSWGATQTSHAGGGGMGAGKVSMQDISAPSATSGGHRKTSKVEAINIKQGVSADAAAKGEKGGTEDINIGVGELQQAGEAEITLKGSAAKLPGKRTPPTVTLKRGATAEAAGGVQVAAGDIDGDGSAAAAVQFNPKELTIDKKVPWNAGRPAPTGSVTVRGKFPSCTVGARYPSLELGARAARYTLHDVVVTSCGGSAGETLPMEEVSFNYAKIEF